LSVTEKKKTEGWIRWGPAAAGSAAWDDLAEAVETFEAPCNDAGEACERWLKEEALDNYPHTATWVLFNAGLIHGFFAICSGVVKISYPNGADKQAEVEKENWPCSQIKWLSKREGGKFRGRSIFRQATIRALEVAALQGNVALVIDPYDDETAALLHERHSFFRTADQGQLWVPLYPEEDLIPSRSE
jgi:hypothetical protein